MDDRPTREDEERLGESLKLDDHALAAIIKGVTTNLLDAQRRSAGEGESASLAGTNLGKFSLYPLPASAQPTWV